MIKYKYIKFEEFNKDIIYEVNLWRAVVIQHITDLSTRAVKNSRAQINKTNALHWIFNQKNPLEIKENKEKKPVKLEQYYKKFGDFHQTCIMAHIDASSVIKQALVILAEDHPP